MCRAPLKDRLINLCFEGVGVVGVRMEWSKECRRTRQVALGLKGSGLVRECIRVVRCDIENLIKLSQCFWETTK